MKVSAIVVSRMDHPLGEVLDSILPHVEELIVVRGHEGVWERWEACARAKCDVVYVQDDDCIVNVPVLLSCYEPNAVVCNMPMDHRADYPDDIALVGWGAVFDKSAVFTAVRAYERWWHNHGGDSIHSDPVFRRESDRVFTGLSPLKLVNIQRSHLPQAHGKDRMGRQANHGASLQEIRRRIYAVRSAISGA